jgi:hypothetical protein
VAEEELAEPSTDTTAEEIEPTHTEPATDDLVDQEPAPILASEDTAPASESLEEVDPEISESSTAPPVPVLAIDGEPHEDDVTPATTEGEQPRSASRPWTPSYSVMNQGPNTTEPEPAAAEEEEEEFMPPPALPSLKVTTDSLPPLYMCSPGPLQRSMSTSSLNVPITPADQDEDRPRSPWTPSYSVTNQMPPEGDDSTAPSVLVDEQAALVEEPAVGITSEDTAPADVAPATTDEDIVEPSSGPVHGEVVDESTQPALAGPEIVVGDDAEPQVSHCLSRWTS